MVAGAREGKVKPDDIEGSTFSFNLGMYDVENFLAILNPPEAAILAVGSAREVPVVENGEIKVGWRMKATISVDHRVSDGARGRPVHAEAGEYLEEPLRLWCKHQLRSLWTSGVTLRHWRAMPTTSRFPFELNTLILPGL